MRMLGAFVVASVAAIAACSAGADASGDESEAIGKKTTTELEFVRHGAIPLRETSGLATRFVNGKPEILAVSDHFFQVGIIRSAKKAPPFDLANDTWSVEIKESGIREAIAAVVGEESIGKKPQWEGIATDKSGRVFILEEAPDTAAAPNAPGRIFVFDPELTKVEQVITLNISDDQDIKDLRKDWNVDPNSRGEGLVLLDNGHILLLKEKFTKISGGSIIEFAPRGEKATGWTRGEEVGPNDTYRARSTSMESVHVWGFHGNDVKALDDMSELAVGPDGDFYILTDKGGGIGHVGKEDDKKKEIDPSLDVINIDRFYEFDVGALEKQKLVAKDDTFKPEGLTFLPNGQAFVARDIDVPGAKDAPAEPILVSPKQETDTNANAYPNIYVSPALDALTTKTK